MKIFVINRQDRPERLAHVRKETEDWLDFEVYPAIIAIPGWIGCRESHLNIMDRCREENQFLILEDDVEFINDWEVVYEAWLETPDDWDAIYLGASPKEPQVRYSDHLFRLKNAHVTHAILWHNRPGGAVEYILSNNHQIRKIDDFFATVIQPQFNIFVTYPMVATQTQFPSDTCKRSDVSTIEKNYNLYCR